LVRDHKEPLELAHVGHLTDVTLRIRAALRENNITGTDGAEIDHVELFGPPVDDRNQSRNFVLCPGGAYDRSPCGTGTSAKIACLAADGLLKPGESWRQESILGSVFTASYRTEESQTIPTISGQAFVTSEATLLLDEADPLAWGGPS
jgi:4-hydroxyproline epimerase